VSEPDSRDELNRATSSVRGEDERWRDCVALALAWIPFSLLVAHFWFVTDDAYISFRYAANWADGMGLRYNLGEHVAVEGFSNFLWVCVTASLLKLGLDPVTWVPAVSALAGFALTGLVYFSLRQHFALNRQLSALTVCALGCCAPFAVWSTGGLETMSFTLLLFLVVRAILLRPGSASGVQAGAFGLLTALSRPEGIYWVLLVLALGWSSRRQRGESTQLGASLGILLTGFAVYTAWRLSAFEHALPTSATAKLSAGIGVDRLVRGFRYVSMQFLTTLSLFMIVPAAWEALRPGRRTLALPLLALALGFPVWAILVSGDFMAFGRFLVPGLPYLALLSGLALARLVGPNGERRALGVLLALFVAGLGVLPAWGLYPVPLSVREPLDFRPHLEGYRSESAYWSQQSTETQRWAERGKALAQFAEPGDSIAISAIGAVGYYSRLFVYDRVGLVTREVAELAPEGDAREHTPGHDNPVEVQWFLNRGERPTFILANFLEVAEKADLLAKVGRAEQLMRTSGLRKFYVLDIREVRAVGQSSAQESGSFRYLFTWKLIPKGVTTRSAWDSLEARVQRHLAGEEFPSVEVNETD